MEVFPGPLGSLRLFCGWGRSGGRVSGPRRAVQVQEWKGSHCSVDCVDLASTNYSRSSATYICALNQILLSEGWVLTRTTFFCVLATHITEEALVLTEISECHVK